MATLVDDRARTRTTGTPEALQALMVTSLMRATKHRPAALQRYCQSSVRAAIRRDGRTDAGQRMIMSDAERTAWEQANPLPA